MAKISGQWAESRRQKAEGRKQKAESRRQWADVLVCRLGRFISKKQRAKLGRCFLPTAFCLVPSAHCAVIQLLAAQDLPVVVGAPHEQ